MKSRGEAGKIIRQWRKQRQISQLDLAYTLGISPKHLSFVETGRSRPSAQLLQTLANELKLPASEFNSLLVTAGHAPQFSKPSSQPNELSSFQHAFDRLLKQHEPYPAVIFDFRRYVIAQNEGAQLINQLISKSLISHPLNLFEIALHPEGLAAHTLNFEAWGSNLLHQLNRLVQRTADPELKAIESTVLEYPNVRERLTILKNYDKEDLASMPIELNIQNRRYSFIITQASFWTTAKFSARSKYHRTILSS